MELAPFRYSFIGKIHESYPSEIQSLLSFIFYYTYPHVNNFTSREAETRATLENKLLVDFLIFTHFLRQTPYAAQATFTL